MPTRLCPSTFNSWSPAWRRPSCENIKCTKLFNRSILTIIITVILYLPRPRLLLSRQILYKYPIALDRRPRKINNQKTKSSALDTRGTSIADIEMYNSLSPPQCSSPYRCWTCAAVLFVRRARALAWNSRHFCYSMRSDYGPVEYTHTKSITARSICKHGELTTASKQYLYLRSAKSTRSTSRTRSNGASGDTCRLAGEAEWIRWDREGRPWPPRNWTLLRAVRT